jgi:hypothetical protein
VVVGTRRPFLLPTVRRPTMRVPAMVAWQMGITSWSSDSKTLGGLLVLFRRGVGWVGGLFLCC